VLVPGQVEDDASVRFGGGAGIQGNAGLLRAVRTTCPDAYIVYKPHPDVLSGNRVGAIAPTQERLWDRVVERVALSECLSRVHEVHTLTSLVGFEALLRGLPVVTYGQPFYAGWGLTQDRHPPGRRTRRRSLDELVAAALLRYPRYVSWSSRSFCSAEDKVWELEEQRSRRRLPAGTPAPVRRVVSLALSGIEWARAREWSSVR
jgi:capsular polysaccharide export protein